MSRRLGGLTGLAVATSVALAACGPSPAATAVKETSAHLHQVHSGELDLKMVSSLASGQDPAGFEVAGPFATASAVGQLPTARLAYSQISGATVASTTVVLTDGQGYLVDRGTGYALTDTQLAPLRATEPSGDDAGLGGLNVAGWARNLRLATGPDADVVTGTVDPVGAMNDLLALAARLGNDATAQPPRLTGADATEFAKAVSSTHLVLTTGHRDRILRQLLLTIDLHGRSGSRLRAALGKLANVRLTVDLSLAHPNQPVNVTPPPNPLPIAQRPKP